ncbi:hypothetical protein F8Q89_09785 [Prevotella copri]|nr:hypothetical protein [Segatella copri]
MMKKTYKSSLLALSVLASFTSCSESESLQQANLSKDKITFHATLDNSWKPMSPASSSRAAIAAATEKGPIVVSTPFGKPLYLHSVVQETADLQQAAAITRGAMQDGTTLDNTYYNNSFGVTAISNSNGTNTALFANQKASKNNEDIWEIEDKTNSRWPFDALVSFHAYAPFNNTTDGMWSVTTDAEKVKTKIKYTAKSGETEIPAQPDIVVATNAESRSVSSDDKAVELKFSHALTAVNFAISKDLTEIFKTEATDGSKLKSIKLSGIPNEGICELTATEGNPQTPSQNWTLDTEADGKTKKTGTYTFDLTKEEIQIGESYALTSNKDKNILMMIPQSLNGTKAQLTFVLDIKGKGDQTFTFDLSNQTWLPGTSVTYKLSASAINHLENAEVKFPDSWKDTEQAKYSYPKTDFNEGESIGLYVVNSNNAIEGENLKCVKQVDGSWKIGDGNTKYLKLKGYKYFAYYPYNAADPTVDVKKDNADEFFKDMITNWNPVKEQNTEDILLSQDLQVGEGVIDNDASTLTFNMAHSMGLAVLNLENKDIPKTRRFVNNNYTYYYPSYEHHATTEPTKGKDYTDDNTKQTVRASNAFSGNIPCSSKITAYRYFQIVKPSTNVSFKASDESGNPRSAWGTHTSYTFNVAQNAAMTKSITTDADFYYLARLFSFKGSTESFTVPVDGTYTLECWGAGENQGGKSKGDYQAQKNTILYICVGGQGTPGDRENIGKGGYNGGGNGGTAVINDKGQPLKRGDGGCGATHICLEDGVLSKLETAYKNNRLLMVAGGQGGAQYPTGSGPFGGGTEGGRPTNKAGTTFEAATQTDGFAFGLGQTGRNGTIKTQNGGEGNGGGGGGLYGGYAPQAPGSKTNSPGGGGSGYVNKKLLVNSETIAGNQSFLSPSGVSETGHAGHGAALISWLP